MVKCPSGKRVYDRPEWAEEALIDAHTVYEFSPGQGPQAYYLCEDCGYYHLTSRGPINERLAEALSNGTIKKMREANNWKDRWK